MKKSIAKKWIEMLRSGEFKQTTGVLESSNGYCCLGVLCQLALVKGVVEYQTSENTIDRFYGETRQCGVLPNEVMQWSGMRSLLGIIAGEKGRVLTRLNDDGYSFNEIADIIEQHYKKL